MITAPACCEYNCKVCTVLCDGHPQNITNDPKWDYDMYRDFPVKVTRSERFETGSLFESHWHEQIQFLYFECGEALIHCNSHPYEIRPNNLMVINSNEIHYGEALSKHLIYYIVKVDLNFLLSSHVDFCQIKYISPLLQGRTRFQNHIIQDDQLALKIQEIFEEYTKQQTGCELSIKAHLYQIIALLLRNHQQKDSLQPLQERQQKSIHQVRTVLEYIDQHYSETITLSQMATLSNMSNQHFCRVFKNLTGKRPMDYINYLRINKAVGLLEQRNFNISEIAMAVGFDDSNYFSRLFKKYQKTSPSASRK